MPELHERTYEAARDQLADQKREVDQLRGRLTPILAAASVIPSLLTTPALAQPQPWYQSLLFLLGALAAVATFILSLLILRPRDELRQLRPLQAAASLWSRNADQQPTADFSLAEKIEQLFEHNQPIIERLRSFMDATIVALAFELLGFATAAALHFL